MTVAATAASVAAITSLAAYINAKYHIGQDVRMLKFKKGAEKHYAELGMYISVRNVEILLPCLYAYRKNGVTTDHPRSPC